MRNGAHTTSYWREGLREGLAVFKAACDGASYPEITPVNPAGGATPEFINVSDTPCQISLFKGNGLKSNSNTHIVYVEIGESVPAPDAAGVASLLAQSLQIKNAAVAVVNSADAAAVGADAVFSAVEGVLGVSVADANRHLMGLGDNLRIVGPLAVSRRPFAGVYLYDSNLAAASGDTFGATQYVLDISDMGANHRAMFNLFCALRDADAKVEYRVRNGIVSSDCTSHGISALGQFIFNTLPIR